MGEVLRLFNSVYGRFSGIVWSTRSSEPGAAQSLFQAKNSPITLRTRSDTKRAHSKQQRPPALEALFDSENSRLASKRRSSSRLTAARPGTSSGPTPLCWTLSDRHRRVNRSAAAFQCSGPLAPAAGVAASRSLSCFVMTALHSIGVPPRPTKICDCAGLTPGLPPSGILKEP